MERTQMSFNWRMDKEGVVYNGVYSAIKKNEILPFAIIWMELEDTVLSEISQKNKYDFTHVEFKKKNKWTQERKEK